ncbi:MAG: hypothetical protein ACR2JM_04850 [Mycobacterium sp.]
MIDVVATVVLALVTLVAGSTALFMSPFLVMATDSADENARPGLMGWAFAVTWGGAAVGVIGSAVGIVMAQHRGALMWIWPLLGLVIIGASFALGAVLATKVAKGKQTNSGKSAS